MVDLTRNLVVNAKEHIKADLEVYKCVALASVLGAVLPVVFICLYNISLI